jgi:hypothetical protein
MFIAPDTDTRNVYGVRTGPFATRATPEREMENIERIRPPAEPLPRPFAMPLDHRTSEAQETAPAGNADSDTDQRLRIVETEGRIFQARLSYDPENAEVFVEILDPTTGDVIRRLPAEKAAEEESVFGYGGALIDRVA